MFNPEQTTTLERKIDRFSSILEQKPGDRLTVLALAEASFRRGLKLEALTNYQTVILKQAVPEAHLAVAEIYSQQDMTSEAYEELRRLFELDPENVEARLLVDSLQRKAPPPEEIVGVMNRPVSEEAFDEAKLRLQIQRTIHNRELQERTRNVTLEPGVVIHEYYVEEAKKKLLDVDDQLRRLEELREHNRQLLTVPRPEAVSPVAEGGTEEVPAPPVEEAGSIEDIPLVPAAQELSMDPPELTPAPEDGPSPLSRPDPREVSEEDQQSSLEIAFGREEESAPQWEESIAVGAYDEAPQFAVSSEEGEPSAGVLQFSEPEPAGADEPAPEDESGSSLLTFSSGSEGVSREAETDGAPSAEPTEGMEAAARSDDEFELEPLPMAETVGVGGEVPESGEFEPPSLEEFPSDPSGEQPLIGDSFGIDFNIQVESPIAPDLPEEPPIEPAPPGFPLAPPEMEPPPPTFEPAHSAVELVDSLPLPGGEPELGGDSDVGPGSGSAESPSLLPGRAVVEPEVETGPALSPGSNPHVLAAERQAFYESKAEELGKLTAALARTRGVTSIFLVARDGKTIDSVVNDAITEERVGDLVRESFDFLLAYAQSPAYWVLECNGGIFVMQTLDDFHVLIAIGQAGANFGALRYTMDKTKTKFQDILDAVPR